MRQEELRGIEAQIGRIREDHRDYEEMFATRGWAKLREWHQRQLDESLKALAKMVLAGEMQKDAATATAAKIEAGIEMVEREEAIQSELKNEHDRLIGLVKREVI